MHLRTAHPPFGSQELGNATLLHHRSDSQVSVLSPLLQDGGHEVCDLRIDAVFVVHYRAFPRFLTRPSGCPDWRGKD